MELKAGIYADSLQLQKIAIDNLKETKLANIGNCFALDSVLDGLALLSTGDLGVGVFTLKKNLLEHFERNLPADLAIINANHLSGGTFTVYRSVFCQEPKQIVLSKGAPKSVLGNVAGKKEEVLVDNIEFVVAKTALKARRKEVINVSVEDFEYLYCSEFVLEGDSEIEGMERISSVTIGEQYRDYVVLTITKRQRPVDITKCQEWVKGLKRSA